MGRQIHKLEDGREIVIKIESDHSTKWVVMAILFGIVAIFFLPLAFFPLALFCLTIGFLLSVFEQRLSNLILSVVAAIFCAVAFFTSPSLWPFLTMLPSPFQHH